MGAATAVAAKYLARADSHTVTICGAGIQGETQLRFLMTVLPIERVFVWARNDASSFAARLAQELKLDVSWAADLEVATRQTDVIVTCTPAKRWFLGRQHVGRGTFIAAVGADSPDKQELEPELLAASSVVCDLVSQCAHVGDLHHAIAGGFMTAEEIRGELGAVIVGSRPKRRRDDEIIVFDSTGTALQDVAAAVAAYENAASQGRGTQFSFWGVS